MHLEGTVQSIVYENPEENYVVFRMQAKNRPEPVVVVGNMPTVVPGEELFLTGQWQNHPKYGSQFRVEQYRQILPSTVAGIKKYLASGLIHGIGRTMAKRLVEAFGDATFDIIEEQPERLTEVAGIGPLRSQKILEAWQSQRAIRDVMVFLHECGLGSVFAGKIFKRYGQQSPTVVREDPYRLAMDIRGIGFRTADRIAGHVGIAQDSLERVQAGLVHVLWEATGQGHVFLPAVELLQTTSEFLNLPKALIEQGLSPLAEKEHVIIEPAPDGQERVYVAPLARAEAGVARELTRLLQGRRHVREFDQAKALDWAAKQQSIELAEAQREAVATALREKVMVLTGGPGTGKTTIVRTILLIFEALRARVLLAAPTGRAARRLAESCRRETHTLHRLLKYEPSKGGFQHGPGKPLKVDLLVVDESSMVDTLLMNHLLRALPDHAAVVFVGDVNQLPSVGPGKVLSDLIESGTLPVARLTEVFRQARRSLIVRNAHRINEGLYPIAPSPEQERLSDFYLIKQDDPEKVREQILEMVENRIPQRFGIPSEQVQVLTPMNRGPLGTQALNLLLQGRLNPHGQEIPRGHIQFRLGDRVMQLRNNYDKDVSNGDIGEVSAIDPDRRQVTVNFEERVVEFDYGELEELSLAYAVSIHKAQGSEFPAVIIPMVTQHYVMLKRNLLYTAVTRARKLAVVVGSPRAVHLALKRPDVDQRYTSLAERLRDPARQKSGPEWAQEELW
jgi:exodeoxyribonuclease V alpha subunit